jgi:cysteinyl-tRNA synthetase
MLQSHYRSPVDYSENSLGEARSALIRVYTSLQLMNGILKNSSTGKAVPGNDKTKAKQEDYINKLMELQGKFNEALDDDFNTAQGLGYVFDAVRLLNNLIASEKNIAIDILEATKKVFQHFGAVLGIFLEDPDQFFFADKEIESRKRGLDIGEIGRLIDERQLARQAKNWVRADEIRQQLAGLHIVLQDVQDKTTWSIE